MSTESIYSVWIHGISGRMGKFVESAVKKAPTLELAGGSCEAHPISENIESIKKSQIIIDFSLPLANQSLFSFAAENCQTTKTFLIATTGLGEDLVKKWMHLGTSKKHRVMIAPNTSIGVLVLAKLLSKASPMLFESEFDCEIVETHHRHKKDSPSGTALFLADNVQNKHSEMVIDPLPQGERSEKRIGIHAIRGGGIFGEHEVRFINEFEELKLSHRALSRELFASGALKIALWLNNKPAGFYLYDQVLPEI